MDPVDEARCEEALVLPHDADGIAGSRSSALLCGHQVLEFGPRQRMMTSTGLGEMGYGLPGAIGASFARDRGEVMCLNCDGGMMMNLQELQTVVHHRLPIKLFIFNNDGYLMIKHTQTNLFAGRGVGVDRTSGVSCPDFSALAAAFGIPAFRIRSWDDTLEVRGTSSRSVPSSSVSAAVSLSVSSSSATGRVSPTMLVGASNVISSAMSDRAPLPPKGTRTSLSPSARKRT